MDLGCRNIRQPVFFEQIGPVRGPNYVKGLTEVSSHNPERLQTAGNPAKGENMAVKPSSYGADRLFARLDLENSEYYPEVTMQQKAAMKVKYFRTRTAQNYYLTQTKQVLASAGVSGITYAPYCAFAGEVAAARDKLGAGETLANEVATLIAKWAGRGLSMPVLESIRTDVFNIAAPVGP
jgi:hypothetical protein